MGNNARFSRNASDKALHGCLFEGFCHQIEKFFRPAGRSVMQ